MAMTDQKQRYADARRKGLTKKESAVLAGCPEQTASQAASRYEKDPDVIAAIARANYIEANPSAAEPTQTQTEHAATPAAPQDDPGPFIAAPADDPLVFLHQVMNDPRADPKLRVDAAKSLASYLHAKPGDKGKKEVRKDAAERVGGGGKYASGAPPVRHGVRQH